MWTTPFIIVPDDMLTCLSRESFEVVRGTRRLADGVPSVRNALLEDSFGPDASRLGIREVHESEAVLLIISLRTVLAPVAPLRHVNASDLGASVAGVASELAYPAAIHTLHFISTIGTVFNAIADFLLRDELRAAAVPLVRPIPTMSVAVANVIFLETRPVIACVLACLCLAVIKVVPVVHLTLSGCWRGPRSYLPRVP